MAAHTKTCSQVILRNISRLTPKRISTRSISYAAQTQIRSAQNGHLRRTHLNKLPASTWRFLSTQPEATSEETEEDLHNIIKDEEKVVGEANEHEFQAETAELLDIVAKSLYSENEVFIREIISNASDALEKLRYNRLTIDGEGGEAPQMEIHIRTDKYENTFTIQDTGIGMTREELSSNLGTIARSGSKAFLKQVADKGDAGSSIIGQFGVGFYSTFMVGSKVTVYTKSHEPDSKGYSWTSEGGVSYKITEAESVMPGTKIVVTLKPDCRKFAEEETVKSIIKKHSAFVGFPVRLNGKLLNAVKPLWTLDPKDIDEDQHLNFFRHLTNNQSDHYLYKLFYKTDAPLNIRSIFYVSEQQPTMLEMARDASGMSGVSLYSRKVLVQHKTTNLLPKWLRFLTGVVDSEDIPLNLSRELLQNSALISKLRETLTSRLIRFFLDQSRRDPEKYLKFHAGYKLFITEGVLSEDMQEKREEVAQLLRYESSTLPEGEVTSFKDYITRMGEERNILYLCAPSRSLAESSPYFESLKNSGREVLFCYDPYDEVTLLQLKTYSGKQLFSLENEVVANSYQNEKDTTPKADGELTMSDSQSKELTDWAKASLDLKVTDVKVTDKLDKHPAMVTVWEMGSVRHFLKSQYLTDPKGLSESERTALFKPTLQLNAVHPIVMKLTSLKNEDEELAKALLEQLYDNAMVSAGLFEDARPMVNRLNDLLTKVLQKH
ncbi:heat shock protein 75 kDa, mitochondrial-like [Ciona intestinalis]